MAKGSYTAVINAPKQDVWQVVSNIGAVCECSPSVLDSHYTSSAKSGVGASRHCDIPGGSVQERVIEWREGDGYTLEVYDMNIFTMRLLIRSIKVTFTLQTVAGGTRITGTMVGELKGGIFGKLLGRTMASQFAEAAKANIEGMKAYIETNQHQALLKVA